MLLVAISLFFFLYSGETLHAKEAAPFGIEPAIGGRDTLLHIHAETARFGRKKGTVLVGGTRCRVKEWSDTRVSAVLLANLPAGLHDIVVEPRGAQEAFVLANGFEAVGPVVDSSGPILIVPKHNFNVSVVNLPRERGRVYLVSQDGAQEIRCGVRRWGGATLSIRSPRPGRFANLPPQGILYDLHVRTRAGNPIAVGDNLFQVMPTLEQSYARAGSFRTPASGIMFGGLVCRFLPTYGDANGILYDFSADPALVGNSGLIIDTEGNHAYTNNCVQPLVVGETLYVFWTTRNGNEFEFTTTDDVSVANPKWSAIRRIKTGRYPPSGGRPNVIYHQKSGMLYLYYVSNDNISYICSGDGGLTWSEGAWIGIEGFADSGIYTDTEISAELTVDEKLVLASGFKGRIRVRHSDSLTSVARRRDFSFGDGGALGAPYLKSLNQGQIVLLWRSKDDCVNVSVYSSDTGLWDEYNKQPIVTDRAPTCMPVFSAYTGDPVKGEGLALDLWTFCSDSENAYGRKDRYLGEIRLEKTGDPIDWSSTAQTGLSENDVWNLVKRCPLLGVVDAPPPCVFNANQKRKDNDTRFSFTEGNANAISLDIRWRTGIFDPKIKIGPVATDLHAEVQREYDARELFSVSNPHRSDPLVSDRSVLAMHSVPVTVSRTFRIYRKDTIVEQLDPVVVLTVAGSSIVAAEIETPGDARLARHHAGELDSYRPTLADYQTLRESGTWSDGNESRLRMDAATIETVGIASHSTLPVGGSVPLTVTDGFDGGFQLTNESRNIIGNSWTLRLDNPLSLLPGDVMRFAARLYLFLPSEAQPGKEPFWAPSYVREEDRGKAWFVTYEVSDVVRIPDIPPLAL